MWLMPSSCLNCKIFYSKALEVSWWGRKQRESHICSNSKCLKKWKKLAGDKLGVFGNTGMRMSLTNTPSLLVVTANISVAKRQPKEKHSSDQRRAKSSLRSHVELRKQTNPKRHTTVFKDLVHINKIISVLPAAECCFREKSHFQSAINSRPEWSRRTRNMAACKKRQCGKEH